MRNSVFAVALLLLPLGCGSAWAADPAAATYKWTGFYVGVNAGFAKDASGYSLGNGDESYSSGGFEDLAFTGGGQAGYNYQAGNFVFGLETDINYDGINDSNTVNFEATDARGPADAGYNSYTVSHQIDYFGTLRGRLGYTPADRLLFYVTGGLAYGEVSSSTSFSYSDPYAFSASSSGLQVGWAAGAGGELALTNNWSVKLEYLHVDLGSMSYTYNFGAPGAASPLATGGALSTTVSAVQNVFRVGLNYKF